MEEDFIGFGRHDDGTFVFEESTRHFCRRCKTMLPKDMFYNSGYVRKKDRKQSLNNICKDCIPIGRSNNSLEHQILIRLKNRAKRKGLEFNLEESDIVIPKHCPVFGFELKQNEGAVKDDSISVDRIDNSKGYIKGNIQIISNLANSMKKSATIDQLIMFANWINKEYRNHS